MKGKGFRCFCKEGKGIPMAGKKQIDMLHGSLFKNILLYALPLMATSVLQLLFNTADLLVVGQYCGSVAVGAVGSTGAITTLLVNLFIGLSVGVSVTVAQGMGAGDKKRVQRAIHTAIPLAALGGVILSVAGVLCSKLFLQWMGNPQETIELATVYMRIYFCGMIANLVYNFGAAILRAAGDTVRPLLFLSIAGVLNVGLNLLFVIGFGMDVDGVALATILSQVVSAVLVVLALMRRQDICHFELKKMKIDRKAMEQILYIGVPASIQSTMFSISNVIIQSAVNSFGAAVVTGSSAASTAEGYIYVCQNAFYQAAMNFTGQNMGAGQIKRIDRIVGVCIFYVTVVGLALGSAVYIFGEQLLGLFVTDSPEAIEYGMIKLLFIGLPYFICGLQEVMTGTLRGMGFSMTTMIISILCACGFRLMWIFTVFQHFHTLGWLFISYVISWSLTFLIALVFYLIKRPTLLRKTTESPAALQNS